MNVGGTVPNAMASMGVRGPVTPTPVYGATWTRSSADIGDAALHTPGLILDAGTGLLRGYHGQRGQSVLWRRVVDPDSVFGDPRGAPGAGVAARMAERVRQAG